MSVDYSASLVVGVKFKDYFHKSIIEDSYEIHDERTGKPTGRWSKMNLQVYTCKTTGKQYNSLEHLLKVDEDSDEIHELIHYIKGDYNSDDFIIGFIIKSIGVYDYLHEIVETKLSEAKQEFRERYWGRLDIEVEPKIYMDLDCGY